MLMFRISLVIYLLPAANAFADIFGRAFMPDFVRHRWGWVHTPPVPANAIANLHKDQFASLSNSGGDSGLHLPQLSRTERVFPEQNPSPTEIPVNAPIMPTAMLNTLAKLERENQEMKATSQHLRARIEKLPQATIKNSQRVGVSGLASLVASIGLAVSVGVVVARKYSGQRRQHAYSMTHSQIPLYPRRAGSIFASAARGGDIRMNQQESMPSVALAKPGTTFEQALSALPANEQYNAVLLGLLSKGKGAEAIDLVQEMSANRLQMSPDALKELLNSAVNGGSVEDILDTMRAARKNGACSNFAMPQLRLPKKPSARDLAKLAPVPSDDRGTELGAAAAFISGLGGLLFFEFADLVDWTVGAQIDAPPLPLVLFFLAAGWGVDRYTQQGELFALLGRGIARLFGRDLQRECTVESASFLVGYLLGLPCCTFAPTATKPLEMISKTGGSLEEGAAKGAARLVDRSLIWLLAPAAIEMLQYNDMLQAEPSLAAEFLGAARRSEATLEVDVLQGGWKEDDDEARVRWAYEEARRLLKRYSGLREVLQDRMAAGVSAGECVVLIEERLKNSWSIM